MKRTYPGRWPFPGFVARYAAAAGTVCGIARAIVESGWGRGMTTDEPRTPEQAQEQAARILARALSEAQQVLAAGERREAAPQPQHDGVEVALQRLADVAERLDAAARGMTDQAERLSSLLERLEQPQPVAHSSNETQPAPQAGPPPSHEPSYPVGEAVSLVVTGVPGFQGLMDVQRGLSGLDGVESASVRRYQGGEANIELVLSRPMAAGDIAGGIRTGTAHRVIVEDAKPDMLQLQLRCLPADA